MRVRITNIVLALLFLSFTLVQFNDPDPVLWIGCYGCMVVLSLLAAWNVFPVKIMIPLAGGYLLLSAMHVEGMLEWLASPNRRLIFDDLAKMQYPYIEEAREFLGLVVCLIVLIFYFYQHKKLAVTAD